jgi:hypothetical protein
MKVLASFLSLSLLASVVPAGPASEPANAKADDGAREVLKYFQSLSGTPAHRIVSGQFANFGPGQICAWLPRFQKRQVIGRRSWELIMRILERTAW